jgi:pyruvate kinase
MAAPESGIFSAGTRMRKTKIVATLGPAAAGREELDELIGAGADVCRLNFSFGTREEHRRLISAVREASAAAGKAVAVLQDLQGPKIRVGKLAMEVELTRHDIVTLTGEAEHTSPLVIPTTYTEIARDTEPGKRIFLADGAIQLEVTEVRPDRKEVVCRVLSGGRISTGKGINLPYTNVSLPSLTEKDREDVLFGLEAGVEYIALSFVRKASDVRELRELVASKGKDVPIIAKIEKPEALETIDEILDVSDGIMVARGDLATEIPLARVPIEQKRLVRLAHRKGKLTIIATQMLESMVNSPRPTRAEASDVANAIFDGADAIMLSAETSIGKYPSGAVKIMDEIAREVEESLLDRRLAPEDTPPFDLSLRHGLCAAASYLSYILDERALAVFTRTGTTAAILSKYRPQTNIFAITSDETVYRRLAMCHNVIPVLSERQEITNSILEEIGRELREREFVRSGDRLIVLSGRQNGGGWQTNTVTVETIA